MSAIELSETQKQELINFYEEKLQKINEEKREILDMLKKLTGKDYFEAKEENEQEIEFKFTWKGLALSSLNDADQFMTTEEVYDFVIQKHPSLKNMKRKKVVAGLSGGLSQHKRNGLVSIIENPYGKGNFWGLKKWVNQDTIDKYINKLEQKGYDKHSLKVEQDVSATTGEETDDSDLPF